MIPLRKWKDNPQNRSNYLKIKYLIKDSCPENIKNPYNSVTKKPNDSVEKWAMETQFKSQWDITSYTLRWL